MLNRIIIASFAVLLAIVSPATSWALVSPVGVSLTPPIQFPFRGGSVFGMRLNVFIGIHEAVYGLDLGGVGNMTDRGFGGVQIAGIFNRNQGPSSIVGAQIAGLTNWNLNGATILGIQATAGFNYNRGKTATLIGIGIGGLGNRCDGKVGGAQIGIYNQAGDVFGLQIGIVNVAKSLHGVQIGLVNIAKNGMLPVFPVLNVGF